VRRLVTLCDQAPPTPYEVVRHVVEKELGGNISEMFDTFEEIPLGSASIAQVSFLPHGDCQTEVFSFQACAYCKLLTSYIRLVL